MFIESLNENKKILLILAICFIIVMLFNFFDNKKDSDKINKYEDYIYTSRSEKKSKMPYINLIGDKISDINIEILDKYLEITKMDIGTMNYSYYKYFDNLSLLISIVDNEGNVDNITYNVSINKKRALSDDELLSEFDLDYDNVKKIMEKYIHEYYNYEVSKGYINKSCNFNCYINEYNIDVYNNYNFFIKDEDLYIYKKINTTYEFLYDENNPFNIFIFKIS